VQSSAHLLRERIVRGIDKHRMLGNQTAQVNQCGIASHKMHAALDSDAGTRESGIIQ